MPNITPSPVPCLLSSRLLEGIVDLTEDSDDELAPVVPHLLSRPLFEGIVDLTEDSDDDLGSAVSGTNSLASMKDTDDENDPDGGQCDLAEFADASTLNAVQLNMDKVQKAKAKRDHAKAPTKNAMRVKRNKASKRSYHSKPNNDRLNTAKRIKQREVRAELDKKPAAKRMYLDKRNRLRAKVAESRKLAKMHNAVYPSNADRLAETQSEKDGTMMLGNVTKYNAHIPVRLQELTSGIAYTHDPLGSVTGEGYYQTITTGSMAAVTNAMLKLVPIEKARFMSTLDIGSGLSKPSLQFSQYFMERGVHFGLERQAPLVHGAKINIKNVTAKGLLNIRKGLLSSSNIKENGELQYVVPPNCISIHGDIMDIVDLGHVDALWGFDDVNAPETFHHMGTVWNHPNSKMCKLCVTNLSPNEMVDCGFKDFVLKDSVRCQLAGLNGCSESRVFYVYLRETLSTRARNKWIFENDRRVATASGPFKEAWERFHKGRLQANTEYSFNTEIVKMNMEYQDQNGWMNNVKRSNRRPESFSYLEK